MHRRGLEPLTPWFVARYSIQLSYRYKKIFILSRAIVSQRDLKIKLYLLKILLQMEGWVSLRRVSNPGASNFFKDVASGEIG